MINFLKQEIIKSIQYLRWSEFIPNFMISVESIPPNRKQFGDYYTNAAMVVYKKEILSPQERAKKIKDELLKSEKIKKILKKIEIVPPGFINFYLNPAWLQKQISQILNQKEKYGRSSLGKGQKVQVEFISANPTGPLTLGNGRGGFFGDVLSNILEKVGFKVQREYYINDTGNQILTLGYSILNAKCKNPRQRRVRLWWKKSKIQFKTQNLYQGKYIEDLAKQIKEKNPLRTGEEAAKIILKNYIKKDVAKMGIKFDNWVSEKSLIKSSQVEKAILKLKEKKMIYQKEGALWFRSKKFGDDQDRVLIRKDGQYTYFASDLAYHLDKFKRVKRVIDFWGADHFGYVNRLLAAMKVFGLGEKLEIIVIQLVRLLKGGKELKMSKRTGTYVTLSELIDEVGLDVARFFFLMYAPSTHLDFDLDKAKERSEKNPVYYVQYASARIHGILAKLKVKKEKFKITNKNLKLLKKPTELNLIKQLVKFPDILEEIAQDYQVQKLPFYALDLAASFHNFYEKCKVISEERDLTSSRINLVLATWIVLKNTLAILGIKAPERM